MATIVWCDHAKYVVEEGRTEVHERIAEVQSFDENDPHRAHAIHGWSYFTRARVDGLGGWQDQRYPEGQQVCLNTRLISAFEAVPGHGV